MQNDRKAETCSQFNFSDRTCSNYLKNYKEQVKEGVLVPDLSKIVREAVGQSYK
jgi:hypothetical protein